MFNTYPRARFTWGRAALALPLASALAMGFWGCTAPAESEATPPPEQDDVGAAADAEPGAPLPPPPPLADVCREGERVGKMIVPGALCPPSADPAWNVQRLFAADSPAPFSQYCSYTWTGAGAPNLATLPGEGGRAGTAWTDSDCMAVTPLGDASTVEGLVGGNLKQSFWNAVERPASLPPRAAPGKPVRVAIIDSWPSLLTGGNAPHGAGMAGIVQNLTCDLVSGECPITIVPHLALNMVAPGMPNEFQGGTFGHQSRLATEIRDAVAAWQAATPAENLVINLSIGWDPAFEMRPGGGDRAAALAVRDALDEAVCAGALVIAAAGNSSFGPAPTPGLIYPAAWSTMMASCGKPLTWTVGGVDAKDRPLYNARPAGIPKLVAPGELAYGDSELTTGMVEAGPYTGSSVSTAVATAAAAAVWMYADTLTGPQVMAQLASTAVPLSISASACVPPGCGNAQRISVCRAARSKAPGGAGSVPCSPHAEGLGYLPQWTPAQADSVLALVPPGQRFLGPPLTSIVATSAPCTTPIRLPAGASTFTGPSACPMQQYPNAVLAPDVGPQPPPDPCGACSFLKSTTFDDSTVYIAVGDDMKIPVYLQTLSLYKAGSLVRRYDVGSLGNATGPARAGFLPGNVYVLGVSTAGFTDFDAAILEWVNTPDIQTTSKMVVFTR